MPDSAVLWGRTSHPTLLFLAIDLTEIQCDVSDISRQYEGLGTALRERLQQLSAMLERMQAVQEEAGAVLQWLESKERTLSELEASSSPTKTETMRAQAEHNKVSASERSCIRRPHQQARCCCCCCGEVEVPDLPWGIPSRWGRSPPSAPGRLFGSAGLVVALPAPCGKLFPIHGALGAKLACAAAAEK